MKPPFIHKCWFALFSSCQTFKSHQSYLLKLLRAWVYFVQVCSDSPLYFRQLSFDIVNELNEQGCSNKENCVERFLIFFFSFVRFVGWASVPASGGGLFRHLLHLTLLATVVIFWLNDAWKWISIFCDQKRYVMAVRYMHYKQPGCLWKWKYHTGLCTSERKALFQASFFILTDTISSIFFCPNHQLLPNSHQYLSLKINLLSLKTHTK